MRQRDVKEGGERASAIHFRGLLLLLVEGLQRRQQDEGSEGQPLPGDDQDDRQQRRLGEPIDRAKPERGRDPGEKARDRMHQEVLQTSALTVGITKKGAMTISLTMLRPITA